MSSFVYLAASSSCRVSRRRIVRVAAARGVAHYILLRSMQR